ncbi:MAG: M23 family metallopeptidase [Chloroflexi bacterium]|nr:M23 family metallopeptidase [Chloroflexota bacterium]
MQTTISHEVQPGDTWLALGIRYGLDPQALKQSYGHINPLREPTIGSVLLLPDTGIDLSGKLIRTDASLLETAVSLNISPWQLAVENGLQTPYANSFYHPLFITGGDEPPRELPVGFETLTFSQVPALPGQAIGVRGIWDGRVAVSATLDKAEMAVFGNGRHLLALTGTGAFYGAGEPELHIQVENQPIWTQPWRFVDDEWTFQQITLTGEAANIDQASIQAERERLFEIWNLASPTPQWQSPFRLPVDQYLSITSHFGARRSYNGGPYDRYHEGVDFGAYGGTAVLASASGTVVIAETLYVRGGTVIIDHGLGVYTGYYHMADVSVAPGTIVAQGQQVGEVGTTGLSTGNHLHWDLLVNGVWVDASAWHEQNMGCWILEGLGGLCEG